MSSLVKFTAQRNTSDGQQLHWGRLSDDGLPFRGSPAAMYRQEEIEDKLVRVADAKNCLFDLNDPEANRKYVKVLDAVANGWFRLNFIERKWTDSAKYPMVYVEWMEYFLEDGSSPVRGAE